MSKSTTTSDGDVQLPDNSQDRFVATDEALPYASPLRGTDRRIARQFVNELNDNLTSCYDDVEVVKVSRTSFMGRLCIRLDTGDTCIGYRDGVRALKAIDTDYELADAYILGSDKFSFGLEL